MKERQLFGLLIMVIGGMLLTNNLLGYSFFSMSSLWPLLILGLGLSFEVGYFMKRRDPGLLVPGGILTVIGTLFVFENMTGFSFAGYTWPIYPFAVAFGLFQLYWFGQKTKGLLIPVFILLCVSVISFSNLVMPLLWQGYKQEFILGIALIVLGVGVMFKRK